MDDSREHSVMLQDNNPTCNVEYFGPSITILTENLGFLYGVNIKQPARDLIFFRFSGCKTGRIFTRYSQFFRVSYWRKRSPKGHLEFVQNLHSRDGQYYIYCPGSVIYLENKEPSQCQFYVFTLPLLAAFSLNKVKFRGAAVDLVHSERLDLMIEDLTVRPPVNWSSQVQTLEQPKLVFDKHLREKISSCPIICI